MPTCLPVYRLSGLALVSRLPHEAGALHRELMGAAKLGVFLGWMLICGVWELFGYLAPGFDYGR